VYNLRQQLRPEQVAEARERWRQAAPADYDLKLFVLTNHDGREERDEYVTVVRGGRVVLVGCNGELLYAAPALAALTGPGLLAPPREDLSRHGVEGLFRQIEETLRQDQASGGRNYATAKFDPADGHPQHYIHRIRGTKERVEWLVRLERPRSP
jgi:hypothetical protein